MSHLPASPPEPAPEGEPDKTTRRDRETGARGARLGSRPAPPGRPLIPATGSGSGSLGTRGRSGDRRAAALRELPAGSPPDSPARRALEAPPARTLAPARMAAGTSPGRHAGRDGDAGPRRPAGHAQATGAGPAAQGRRRAPDHGRPRSPVRPRRGGDGSPGVRPDRRPGSAGSPGRQVVDRASPRAGRAARRGAVAALPGPGARTGGPPPRRGPGGRASTGSPTSPSRPKCRMAWPKPSASATSRSAPAPTPCSRPTRSGAGNGSSPASSRT